MKNNLIKAIAKGGMVRISSIDGTEIVQKAAEFHKTSAKDEELVCHFCNKKYIFTPRDIQKLI